MKLSIMRQDVKKQREVAELIKPYSGQWVTVSSDKKTVLGFSPKMEVALNQAHRKGEGHPLLIKAPDANTAAFFY